MYKRGVFSKSATEGDKQEWHLANTCNVYAGALTERWPRTGAMLQRTSDVYASEASQEDIRALS